MELHRENICARGSAGETKRVQAVACGELGSSGLRKIAVNEIKACAVGNALPQRVSAALVHFVPAHVRHLELIALRVDHVLHGKAADSAGEQSQAGRVAFFAVLEEHLQADANSEKWFF